MRPFITGQHLRRDLSHLTRLSSYQVADYLVLDGTTLRHLEILEPLHRDADKASTLFAALNKTVTPMGARRLRDWLSQPLSSQRAIQARQAVVGAFLEKSELLAQVRTVLAESRDLERTLSRLSVGSGNGRDLLALLNRAGTGSCVARSFGTAWWRGPAPSLTADPCCPIQIPRP